MGEAVTPKKIQEAVASSITYQLVVYGRELPADMVRDIAAQAATIISAGLEECEDCGYRHDKCLCAICKYCDAPIDGYEPTKKDLAWAPHDGECEECHQELVRSARRDEYAGLERGDADYYNSGENWRGE